MSVILQLTTRCPTSEALGSVCLSAVPPVPPEGALVEEAKPYLTCNLSARDYFTPPSPVRSVQPGRAQLASPSLAYARPDRETRPQRLLRSQRQEFRGTWLRSFHVHAQANRFA